MKSVYTICPHLPVRARTGLALQCPGGVGFSITDKMEAKETHDTVAMQLGQCSDPGEVPVEGADAPNQVPSGKLNQFGYEDGLFSVPLHEVPPEVLLRVVRVDLRNAITDLENIRHRLRALGEYADPAGGTIGSVDRAMAALALAQAKLNHDTLRDLPKWYSKA